jgi:dUTP pyrophosphatase
MLEIKIKKINENAIIPKYAHIGDAGMDVVAVGKEINKSFIEYRTGLSFEIPKNYVLLIFPRSSVSNKDLILSNCVGVLDSSYRGELIIRFKKIGEKEYEIGDKIAQIIILPYPEIIFLEVDNLSITSRGKGNFGSTGN